METHRHLANMELMSTRQRILHFLVEYTEGWAQCRLRKVVRNILTHQELGSLCQAAEAKHDHCFE
ncbi:MAG: hypothetical protein R2788_16130 [Saprospiraceae bacterium]